MRFKTASLTFLDILRNEPCRSRKQYINRRTSTRNFSHSVQATLQTIEWLIGVNVTIATTDRHRGKGVARPQYISIGSRGPIGNLTVGGTLSFDSWEELESAQNSISVSTTHSELEASFTIKGKPVGSFTGPINFRRYNSVQATGSFEWWYFPITKSLISFSIFSGQNIYPDKGIEVHTESRARGGQGAINILRDGKQFDVLVTDGNPIRVPTGSLSPGKYNVMVGELATVNHQRLNHFYRVVEFNILEPTDNEQLKKLRIAHIVETEVFSTNTAEVDPEVKETEHAEIVKAIDENGNEVVLSYKDGQAVDNDKLQAEIKASLAPAQSRIHRTLAELLKTLARRSIDYNKSTPELPPQLRESLEAIFQARDAIADYIGQQGDEVTHSPPEQPYLHATVPKSRIQALSEFEHVGVILYHDQSYEIDLGDSIAVARSDVVFATGQKGKNVNVAVHENGPRDTTNLDLAGRYTDDPDSTEKSNNHARLTHAIVKNIQPDHPHGHAPDCSLYSADSHETAALEWALKQDCTVISQSFHRGSGAQSPNMQADDILKDWFATRWPFPTIVMASGNLGGNKKYVNHKSYNTLIVGSHNDSALEMSGSTEYRNPASPHHDRELPEIAANGTVVGANDQLNSGTSFSAPAVAGVVALIQGMNPALTRHPEGCRAILLASSNRNVVGGTWWGDLCARIDGKAGAGALDAEVGMDIASRRGTSWGRPSQSGWDVDTLFESDFNENRVAYSQYYIQTPSASPTSASSTALVVKAALAWNSKVRSSDNKPLSSELTVDLDLVVKDAQGNVVAVSTSFDNSYEIVEFYGAPDHIYELNICWATGEPATWYGIAWTVRVLPWTEKRP
ncbi:hypothetical protein ABW19_dt0205950 [Dactylella cylindrospora]|nr:hypothetical protein ABW19_dt0205950 [Dactylella cylindrospora]